LRKGLITGASSQTILAIASHSVLVFLQQIYWPIVNLVRNGRLQTLGVGAYFVKSVAGVDMVLLLGCVYLMRNLPMTSKESCTGRHDHDEDDFGKKTTRSLWHGVRGYRVPPPAGLHYSLVYAVGFAVFLLTGWASSAFSFSALATWAYRRPTAMLAIMDNSLRGLALMPQLHMSRKTGVIAPGLAVWMALMGVTYIMEISEDGIAWDTLCYLAGDAFSIALVADFLYLFVRSRLRGQAVVEIPTLAEV
jgi:hypothetical protein